jgi:citrate/tricarballylate utilization protein
VLFTRAARGSRAGPLSASALLKACADAIGLRYLSGGGEGCYDANPDRPSALRRVLHSLLVYGFAAAFLSTLLAALYQNVLGQPPPYPLLSAPVLTGAAGGLAMIAGSSGLIFLKLRSPRVAGRVMLDLDLAFLANLDLASITGMLLLALRGTSLMGSLLVAHLAVLVALFATAPYGKFVHAVHRFGALVLNRLEVATGSPR